jgi:RHS repeat-associated protein
VLTPYGDLNSLLDGGGQTMQDSQSKTPFLFTGHRYDTEADLHYMGARYYDPLVGRFQSVDPELIGPGAGVTFGRIGTGAVHASAYAYAMNRPTGVVDPTGRSGYEVWVTENGKTRLARGKEARKLERLALRAGHLGTFKSGGTTYGVVIGGSGAPQAQGDVPSQEGGGSTSEGLLPDTVETGKTAVGNAAAEKALPEKTRDRTGGWFLTRWIQNQRHERVQKALDFVNVALRSGAIEAPWLRPGMVTGVIFDPRDIPGEEGRLGGGVLQERGPSNASPIVVFWVGASSVARAVNVLGHEIGHFGSFPHGTREDAFPGSVYWYGNQYEDLYRGR